MYNTFERFTHFGSIANKDVRKKLASEIHELITIDTDKEFSFDNSETDNFADAVKTILANETMKELCIQDGELAEKITQEILEFINKTKKKINKTDNPFEKEIEILSDFNKTNKAKFHRDWKVVNPFLEQTYEKKVIDTSFYEKEFNRSLDDKRSNEKDKTSFESVIEHFMEKWSELLFKKKTRWELEIIEEQRKKFCEELYKQIEELKKIQEVLEPFTNELGLLWDMSKGNWQRANFDILKKYAELLKKDKSIRDLAEMLGRMRQAEKEYEEEIFSNISIKPEWKASHANKSDLIGIRESDDLSSLLPSETALLADATMQSIFFQKFAEKKLQTYEYQAKVLSNREEEFQEKRQKEKQEKQGPFIICVDTSGSMHGIPETVAKTLCFAILKIAIRDNRKCYLISFSTSIETLNLTDLKNSLDRIIHFLSMSFNGGTDATPAMREALRVLTTEDYKKADVIMISDFVMSAFDNLTHEQILKAKENKTKFHSLVVGNSQNPAIIADFDNNWIYNTNNPNSILTLVKNINDL